MKGFTLISALVKATSCFFQKEDKRVIAIPIKDDQGLDSELSQVLARATSFLVINTDHRKIRNFHSIDNPYAQAETEAGLEVARYLLEKGIDVLITLEIGSVALRALRDKGIDVYINQAKTAKGVIEELFDQELMQTKGTTKES